MSIVNFFFNQLHILGLSYSMIASVSHFIEQNLVYQGD